MSTHHITTILIDLDGTLLPMDRPTFMKAYLEAFAGKCKSLGLPVERSLHALGRGLEAMMGNDGSMSNERRFWEVFSHVLGMDISEDHVSSFLDFYRQEFARLEQVVSSDERARELVLLLREGGFKLVLATTPVFPRYGTLERIRWAGLDPSWFDLITTYEDFSFAKPNLGYYHQILGRVGADASECLMIGNDVSEDMVVRDLGMEVFLITDWLINHDGHDISSINSGSIDDALAYCRTLGRAGGVA